MPGCWSLCSLSTDPYLFGNGANLEHFINLFSVASLALLIYAWDHPSAGLYSPPAPASPPPHS